MPSTFRHGKYRRVSGPAEVAPAPARSRYKRLPGLRAVSRWRWAVSSGGHSSAAAGGPTRSSCNWQDRAPQTGRSGGGSSRRSGSSSRRSGSSSRRSGSSSSDGMRVQPERRQGAVPGRFRAHLLPRAAAKAQRQIFLDGAQLQLGTELLLFGDGAAR